MAEPLELGLVDRVEGNQVSHGDEPAESAAHGDELSHPGVLLVGAGRILAHGRSRLPAIGLTSRVDTLPTTPGTGYRSPSRSGAVVSIRREPHLRHGPGGPRRDACQVPGPPPNRATPKGSGSTHPAPSLRPGGGVMVRRGGEAVVQVGLATGPLSRGSATGRGVSDGGPCRAASPGTGAPRSGPPDPTRRGVAVLGAQRCRMAGLGYQAQVAASPSTRHTTPRRTSAGASHLTGAAGGAVGELPPPTAAVSAVPCGYGSSPPDQAPPV